MREIVRGDPHNGAQTPDGGEDLDQLAGCDVVVGPKIEKRAVESKKVSNEKCEGNKAKHRLDVTMGFCIGLLFCLLKWKEKFFFIGKAVKEVDGKIIGKTVDNFSEERAAGFAMSVFADIYGAKEFDGDAKVEHDPGGKNVGENGMNIPENHDAGCAGNKRGDERPEEMGNECVNGRDHVGDFIG